MIPTPSRPTRRILPLDTPEQRRTFRRQMLGMVAVLITMSVILYNLHLWLPHLLP